MSDHTFAVPRHPTPFWVRAVVVTLGTAVAAAIVVPLALEWAGASAVEGVLLEAAAGIGGRHVDVLTHWALSHPFALALGSVVTGTCLGLAWIGRRQLRAAPDRALPAPPTALPLTSSPGVVAEDSAAVARRFAAEVQPLLESLRRIPAPPRDRDRDEESLQLTLAV